MKNNNSISINNNNLINNNRCNNYYVKIVMKIYKNKNFNINV